MTMQEPEVQQHVGSNLFYGCWDHGRIGLWTPEGVELDLDRCSPINPNWLRKSSLCPNGTQRDGDVLTSFWPHTNPNTPITHPSKSVMWTTLATWDRSVNNHPDTSAVFLVAGKVPVKDALNALSLLFPNVWKRLPDQIRLVGVSSWTIGIL